MTGNENMSSGGRPASDSVSGRRGGPAWFFAVGFLALCWLLLLAESVNGSAYDFASTFDRGWVCGTGTAGILLLIPFGLLIALVPMVLSGRSDFGFVVCTTLAVAAALGRLRGSRPVFCVIFFGAAAVLLLVPAAVAFVRNRRQAGRLRGLGIAFAIAAGAGIAGHLGWGPDFDAVFRERAEAAVEKLRSCVEGRAGEPAQGTLPATAAPAATSSDGGLSPVLAACTATERDPQWRGRRFVLQETGREIVGEVLFRYGGRDYRHPFRFAVPVGPGAAGEPPERHRD